MNHIKIMLKLMIAMVLLAALCPICVNAEDGTWAVYMYVCGSDLESKNGFASDNLVDLMRAGRTADTTFVAQTGGASEWQNNFVDADKMQRWLYTDGDMELVDEGALVNMGESDTLADFLEFAVTNYPAEHTMLILWNHGGGTLGGCCIDENFDGDRLTLTEMHDAFSRVYNLSEATPPIDILGFDCCLMATIDVADTFKDTAHYLIASEEVEPSDGWDYDYIGSVLGAYPSLTPLELGTCICESYYERLQRIDEECETHRAETATLSLTDLSLVGNLKETFNSFADNMLVTAYNDPNYFRNYYMIAKNSENYGGNSRTEGYMDLTDIKDFVENFNGKIEGSDEVLTALEDCVIYKVNGDYRTEGGGLSFYFDYDGMTDKNDVYIENGSIDALKALYTFGLSAEMDESVFEYMGVLGIDPESLPEINTFEDYESYEIPIQFDEEGLMYADFGEELASCMTNAMYQLYYIEDGKTYFLGSDDEVIYSFASGLVSDRMHGNWMYFDKSLVRMDLVYDSATYNLYSIPVKIDGEEMCLQIGYDFLRTKWDFLGASRPNTSTAMTSRALRIEKGTEITPLHYILCTDGSLIIEEGQSFLFDPATCFDFEPLVNGRYAIQFAAEDLYTDMLFSELIVFDFENGKRTYDADADIPFIDIQNTTAEDAASDGEIHTAQLNIINNTSLDIVELYIAAEQDDVWGDECLAALSPLEAGNDLAAEEWYMHYSADYLLWALRVVDSAGKEHIFDWDISGCDSESMQIKFTQDDDGSWEITY